MKTVYCILTGPAYRPRPQLFKLDSRETFTPAAPRRSTIKAARADAAALGIAPAFEAVDIWEALCLYHLKELEELP